MRKVLALLLSLLMLTPALAEETVITPLPMGLTDTGYTPDPNAFIAADEENGVLQGYQDDSITVTLWRETVGDATYKHRAREDCRPVAVPHGAESPQGADGQQDFRDCRKAQRCRGDWRRLLWQG